MKRYLPGAGGMSAGERAKLFRTAWDFVGSAIGGRVELYKRFYVTSAARNFAMDLFIAQQEREWSELPNLLQAAVVD